MWISVFTGEKTVGKKRANVSLIVALGQKF